MTNEPTERTTPRSIRISNSLWSRVEAWAEKHGAADASDALRTLVQLGLSAPVPERTLPIQPPLKWMLPILAARKQRHDCGAVVLPDDPNRTKTADKRLRMREVCLGAPCPQAWKWRPREWFLVRATRRTALDEWDALDRVLALNGAVELPAGSQGSWAAIPHTAYPALVAAFSDYPNAVSVHHLKVSEIQKV